MYLYGNELEKEAVLDVAAKMCLAARTAPKARGTDFLVTCVITGENLVELAAEMKRFGDELDAPFFLRDSENVQRSEAVVLMGTRYHRLGIPGCNYCGFQSCADSERAGTHCAFNLGDLGIALGSAVSIAANHRVDNRIMYTVGRAAVNLKLLGEDVRVAYGIPLSVSSKSPYFDR